MADATKILFPGVEVVFEGGYVARVYPLGFKHIRKFSTQIAGALMTLMDTKVPKKFADDPASAKAFQDAMFAKIVPYVLTNFLDLLADCVVMEPKEVKIDDLPHWDVAKLAEVWLIESFGEEKKRLPWVAAMENVFAQVTGERKKMSEIFSPSSSSPAITAPTS